MAAIEQGRRTAVVLGGATLALALLWAGRATGQGGGGAGAGPGSGAGTGHGGGGSDGDGNSTTSVGATAPLAALPAPSEVVVWIHAGDHLELDGVATSLETMLVRARAVGRARVHANGSARVGWIGKVINELRAAQVTVLAEPGLLTDADYVQSHAEALGQPPASDARNAAPRRGSLPRYDERRGLWAGGDGRTLYTFASNATGRTWVVPGGYRMYWGPGATVRVATRGEAEAMWQRPLHPGWKVAEAPRNASSLERVGSEMFATKPLHGDGVTVLQTSTSIQGAIASAPARGDLQVRGEYTSDGARWGLGLGRLVARREQGRWFVG